MNNDQVTTSTEEATKVINTIDMMNKVSEYAVELGSPNMIYIMTENTYNRLREHITKVSKKIPPSVFDSQIITRNTIPQCVSVLFDSVVTQKLGNNRAMTIVRSPDEVPSPEELRAMNGIDRACHQFLDQIDISNTRLGS